MRYIIKKVFGHVPKTFMSHRIFLAADMAIPANHCRTAIQTIGLFSEGNMAHL